MGLKIKKEDIPVQILKPFEELAEMSLKIKNFIWRHCSADVFESLLDEDIQYRSDSCSAYKDDGNTPTKGTQYSVLHTLPFVTPKSLDWMWLFRNSAANQCVQLYLSVDTRDSPFKQKRTCSELFVGMYTGWDSSARGDMARITVDTNGIFYLSTAELVRLHKLIEEQHNYWKQYNHFDLIKKDFGF